jgi:hypothetical protein
MKTHLRAFLALAILAVAATVLAAEGRPEPPEAPLKITADYLYMYDPVPATDRRVADYYASIIVDRTGVDATWQNSAITGKSTTQLLTEWLAAGNLPEVIRCKYLFNDFAWADPWTQQRLGWTWDAATMRKLLPNYVARLEKYGQTVEEVLRFNTYEGENWYIPTNLFFAGFPKLASLPEARTTNFKYYAVGFRDDVLRRIYPKARTEADLLQVYAKNGRLTPQDIVGDIPLKSKEDLGQYLRKVKALNLKVGDKPLIPGALTSTSEALGSIDWSLRTIIGYHWSWPLILQNPPSFEGSFFIRWSPEYREYLRWWNSLYNEGLLDPEIFVMKNDQYYSKLINGEYAVVNFWAPVADARKVGSQRGYGYRYFPLFWGGAKPVYSNTTSHISLQGEPVTITRSVSTDDLPRVARWVDWYLSEDHDALNYWGTPDMYTGNGKARRYRPEFRDLEDWAVYGAPTANGGDWFGIQHAFPATPGDEKMPLGGISFFPKDYTYPEAPYFVYPKDPARLAKYTDIWKVCDDTMYHAVWDEITLWTYAPWPTAEYMMDIPGTREWDQYISDHSELLIATVVRLVTGPASEFDANYATFHKLYQDAGTAGIEREGAAMMAEYYRTQVLPNRIKR